MAYHIEDNVHAVRLDDERDERGGDRDRVHRAALDDDAEDGREDVARAVLRGLARDVPDLEREQHCKEGEGAPRAERGSGTSQAHDRRPDDTTRHVLVVETFVARLNAYTAVIHCPVWTAKTSPL